MMLAMILVTLLAAASSLSVPQRSFVKLSSKPSATQQQAQQERTDPRLSFNYRYRVEAPDTGDEKSHQEALQDGVLVGAYSLVQPDGTLRTVTYSADDTSGFKADVQFQEGYADPLLQQQRRLTQGSVAPLAGTPHTGSRLEGVGRAGDTAASAPAPHHALAQDPGAFTSGGRQSAASPAHSGTLASGYPGALSQKDSTFGSGAPDSQAQRQSTSGSGISGAQAQQESTLGSGTSDLPLQQDSASSSEILGPHGSVIGEGTSFTAGSSVSAVSTSPVARASDEGNSSSQGSSTDVSAETGGTFVKWDASSLPVQHSPHKPQAYAGAVHQSQSLRSFPSGSVSSHNVQIQSFPFSGMSPVESSFKGSALSSFSSSSFPSSSSSSTSFASSSVLQLSKAPDPYSTTITKDRVSGSHFAKTANLGTLELAKRNYDDQTYTYRLSFFPVRQ
ncbi:uncharacterized protein LOC126997551 isoform X2 [Eriocheir sinensis]|uniref:uncharacterized protein LOC126997551 isoform X2 n=1 Tax=Eriocheir sinensis TaxID=95602 RepID=UPI0021C94EBB|nr:uncharacterized protein LOC126997551 isoform X2 [Eriocheir sinensis]